MALARQYSQTVIDIGDKIADLTLKDCVELGEYLENIHGIKQAGNAIQVIPPPLPDDLLKKAEPEQTEFSVIIEGFDAAKKINAIKIVREITALGLKEAKDLVESAPKMIRDGISRSEAEALKKKLEEGGAQVSIK